MKLKPGVELVREGKLPAAAKERIAGLDCYDDAEQAEAQNAVAARSIQDCARLTSSRNLSLA